MNKKVLLFGTSMLLLTSSVYVATTVQAQDSGDMTKRETRFVSGMVAATPKYLTADGSEQVFPDGTYIVALSDKDDPNTGLGANTVNNGVLQFQMRPDIDVSEGSSIYLIVVDMSAGEADSRYLPYEFKADSDDLQLGDITIASKLKELEVTTPPTKTTYKVGESFDKVGMQVTAKYENDGAKVIDNYTYEPTGALTTANDKITIKYTENGIEKTAEQPITVRELEKYTVNFTADSNGKIEGAASAVVEEDSKLTSVPKATPNTGYKFSHWEDENGKQVDPLSVAITKNQTFKATFAKAQEAVETQDLYRLYNPNSGEHFYTLGVGERNWLQGLGWDYEGITGKQPKNEGQEVYRLYNKNAGDHHYTLHKTERDWLIGKGWTYEIVAFRSGGPKEVYRLYNPKAKSGSHHYTQLVHERNWLMTLGWEDEGIGWNSY